MSLTRSLYLIYVCVSGDLTFMSRKLICLPKMELSTNLGDLEMILNANLDLNSIDQVFSVIMSKRCSKRGIIVGIESNTLVVGAFSNLDTRAQKLLLESHSCIPVIDKDTIRRIFREMKNVLILLLNESVLIATNDEVVAFLKCIINDELENGTLIKRRIDCDILMSLLAISDSQEYNEDKSQDETLSSDNDSCTTVHKETEINRNSMSTVAANSPRYPHSTTAVEIILEHVVFPNGSQEYNKTLLKKGEGCEGCSNDYKYPTQVTEIDAGLLSIESNLKSKSSIHTDRTNDRRSFEEQKKEFSNEIPKPTNKSIVTSGTKIPLRPVNSRYPDYIEQQQRLTSFQTPKWAIDNKPDPFLLAEWGFFFTGNQDLVRCFQCGIGLKDWIKDDDVLSEHVKHSTSCDFLKSKFGTHRIDRMKLSLSQASNSQTDATTNNGSQLPYKIRSPRYQTMEVRVASYKEFPSHIQIPHQQLAVAGLFFTGNGDLCRCFTCDGGLKDWTSGDDPVKEHATYFPRCAYIKQLKGEEYVQQQQSRVTSTSEPNGATCSNSTAIQPSQALPNSPMDRVSTTNNEYLNYHVCQVVEKLGYAEKDVIKAKQELTKKGKMFPSAEEIINTMLDIQERTENFQTNVLPQRSENDLPALVDENTRLSKLVYCMLCVTAAADILFLPCTHHRICHECALNVNRCPVCNRSIEEKVKTYRS